MSYDISVSNKKIEINNAYKVLLSYNVDIASFNNFIQKKRFGKLLLNQNIKLIEVYKNTLKVYLFFNYIQISFKKVSAYINNLLYFPAPIKDDSIKMNFILSLFSNNSSKTLNKTPNGRAGGSFNLDIVNVLYLFHLVINGGKYTAKSILYNFYLIIIVLEETLRGIINIFKFILDIFKYILKSILFVIKFIYDIITN